MSVHLDALYIYPSPSHTHTAKLGDLQAAVQQFEQALELAKLLEDQPSQDAIHKALEEVNMRIVEEVKPLQEEEEGGSVEGGNVEVDPAH